MNAVNLDVALLAMSLDHARMGLDAAKAQQPAATPSAAPDLAAQSGVILELSAAAQALLKS
jgi:hypothetical protein